RQATVAVEATGLAPGAISAFFVKRAKDREPGFTWRHWLKWTMVADVDRRIILAQTARRGPTNDCATLRPLVDRAHQHVSIGLVLADAEFDSELNHQHIRQTLQAHSVIPAKRGGAKWRIHGVRAQMRRDFPGEIGVRSCIITLLKKGQQCVVLQTAGAMVPWIWGQVFHNHICAGYSALGLDPCDTNRVRSCMPISMLYSTAWRDHYA